MLDFETKLNTTGFNSSIVRLVLGAFLYQNRTQYRFNSSIVRLVPT